LLLIFWDLGVRCHGATGSSACVGACTGGWARMNKQDVAVSGTKASSAIFVNSWIANVISVNTIPVYTCSRTANYAWVWRPGGAARCGGDRPR